MHSKLTTSSCALLLFLIGACYFSGINFLSTRSLLNTDYGKFYNSSQLFFAGKNIYLGSVYAPDPGPAKIRLTNLNSPWLSLLMLPLGRLNYSTSLWLWTLFSVGIGMASLGLVSRTYGITFRRNHALWLALSVGFFAYYPTFIGIITGQVELFTLFFLVAAWYAIRNGYDRWGGAMLGIAFSIKLFIGLFVVLFILRRQWRLLAWFIVTAVLCAAIAGS